MGAIKNLLYKFKIISTTIFSRSYFKQLTQKLFTKKSACIVVSSIVIGNVIRYFAIKYGINAPLLEHPILLSSAAGISSFLSISSKITIEQIFELLDNKELMCVGGHAVGSNSIGVDTPNLMVTRGNGLNLPVQQDVPHNLPVQQDVPHNLPLQQDVPHNLPVQQDKAKHPVDKYGVPLTLIKYERFITNEVYLGKYGKDGKTLKVFVEVNENELSGANPHRYLSGYLRECKDYFYRAKEENSTLPANERLVFPQTFTLSNVGFRTHACEEKIINLAKDVRTPKSRNIAVTEQLIADLRNRN